MDRRPDYLPAAVWQFYRELDERELLSDRDRKLIARLFAPGMQSTWRVLAKSIRTETDWRRVADLLLTLRLSFDKGARDGLRRARELMPEIAKAATDLAERLREYQSLSAMHSINQPAEFYFGELASIVLYGRCDEPDPDKLPSESIAAIDPAALIAELARGARHHKPECSEKNFAAYASDKASTITAFVRHFDSRWRDYQNRGAIPARCKVGNTDLASIASAVLGLDVSREAVGRARSRS